MVKFAINHKKIFHWYFLLVKEKVGGNFQRHLAVGEKCWWNLQRHFSWERKKCWWKFSAALWLWEKMSVEISIDILAVTEKMSVEISSDILAVWEKMSVEISSDILAEWEKMSVEISSDISTVREKCWWIFQWRFSWQKTGGGNFQRHFGCESKCRWKFSATF